MRRRSRSAQRQCGWLCRDEASSAQQISRSPRVLLAVSGSVAAIKMHELAAELVEFADVRVLMTAGARNFVSDADLPAAVRHVYGVPCQNRPSYPLGHGRFSSTFFAAG